MKFRHGELNKKKIDKALEQRSSSFSCVIILSVTDFLAHSTAHLLNISN